MPYIGPTPFLHNDKSWKDDYVQVFQCPISGPLHFYRDDRVVNLRYAGVSMPYIGPTPFLQVKKRKNGQRNPVSMPYIGPTPFLLSTMTMMITTTRCFNALYRANSISTNIKLNLEWTIKSVSMPYIGPTPFLQNKKTEEKTSKMVSMPYIGPTPFLLGAEKVSNGKRDCFNALYRAHSISTQKAIETVTKILLFQCPISGPLHFYVCRFGTVR